MGIIDFFAGFFIGVHRQHGWVGIYRLFRFVSLYIIFWPIVGWFALYLLGHNLPELQAAVLEVSRGQFND
jgi:hypothetical protein